MTQVRCRYRLQCIRPTNPDLALECLRGLLQEINNSHTLNKVIGNIPVLNFCSDTSTCVECGIGLIVEKVKMRVVYTVAYGRIGARETIKMCPACQATYRSRELPQIVKSGSNYSYDCMVEAGMFKSGKSLKYKTFSRASINYRFQLHK